MMAEDVKELYLQLDDDIRKLLTLIHEVKLDIVTGNYNKTKIERALFLSQRITAELYELVR